MNRLTRLATLVTVLALTSITAASAQRTSVFLGGGGLVPSRDFDDRAAIGWVTVAGIVVDLGSTGFFIAGDGFYGSADHHGAEPTDETNVFGVLGEIGYSFSDPGEAGFYVFGGAGWIVNQLSREDGTEANDNQAGYVGGLGYGFPLGPVSGWVEGRYVASETKKVHFFGAIAGISISLGG